MRRRHRAATGVRHRNEPHVTRAPWSVLGATFVVALLMAGHEAGSATPDQPLPAQIDHHSRIAR